MKTYLEIHDKINFTFFYMKCDINMQWFQSNLIDNPNDLFTNK